MRQTEADQFAPERRVLLELKAKGFQPAVIYDIGASTGIWSDIIAGVLPNAEYHLFEPLAHHVDFYQAQFRARQQRLPNLKLHSVALGEVNDHVEMCVFHDGYGSSVHDVHESSEFKEKVLVPRRRLDDYTLDRGLPPADLIKIDCQGAEDAILRGAERALKHAKILFVETWFERCYGPKNPLITEIVDFLREKGFSLVELGERFYDAKHRLTSVDAFFFSESLLESVWLSPPASVPELAGQLMALTTDPATACDADSAYSYNALLRGYLDDAMRGAPNHSEPVDVVVTPNEINGRHGTGPLVKRVLKGRRNIFSIRSRDHWGGHEFGDWNVIVSQDGQSRAECAGNVRRVLAGRKVRSVVCIPSLSDELLTSIAIQEVFNARLCAYLMDDQNVAAHAIPDELMREFLEKCCLRLATHPELRTAYERKYGLPFSLLPAVVPAHLVAREPLEPAYDPNARRGLLLGSFWDQSWFDRLCSALHGSGYRVDWYGNNRSPFVKFPARDLARAGITPLGLVSEEQLAAELRNYPFVIVPVGALDDKEINTGVAALSLPGRILFAAATSHTPILVVGSDDTCAARFVRRFGIGEVAPYKAAKLVEAMERLNQLDAQKEMRRRAAAMALAFSDYGVAEWLAESIERGGPVDARFESAFSGYHGELAVATSSTQRSS